MKYACSRSVYERLKQLVNLFFEILGKCCFVKSFYFGLEVFIKVPIVCDVLRGIK